MQNVLGLMSIVLRKAGRHRESVAAAQRAVVLMQELGDRSREAELLGTLGSALVMTGDSAGSVACHKRQLAIASEIGDRSCEASALFALSRHFADDANLVDALKYARRALGIRRELDDPRTRIIEQRVSDWEERAVSAHTTANDQGEGSAL